MGMSYLVLSLLLLVFLLVSLTTLGFKCANKNKRINRIKYYDNTFIDNNIENLENIESTLKILQQEREKKKLEVLAVEIAIKDLENELKNKLTNDDSSKTILQGTYDYGFSSKSSGSKFSGKSSVRGSTVPPSAIYLAFDNFAREISNLINEKTNNNITEDKARNKLKLLTLSNEAIWKRKELRQEVKSPLIIKIPYLFLCKLLDVLFEGRPINRFYFLETVARMPYFSYITMLHIYETLGWWRRSTEAKRVHFAEEYNEFHHLLIWESLGGDQEWYVRFFAQHAAVLYFFCLSILWTVSPSLSYNFSELIEMHAVDTYAQFAEENKELLLTLSAPPIAKAYYEALDLYVFDEFQTNSIVGLRRPKINSLYDVVCSIRDDEKEHSATMKQCQDPNVVIRSPNTEAAIVSAAAAAALVSLIASGQLNEISFDDLNTIISSATTASSSSSLASLEKLDIEEISESSLSLVENIMKFVFSKIL